MPLYYRVSQLQNFSRKKKSRRREVNLTSVLNLQHSVRTQLHRGIYHTNCVSWRERERGRMTCVSIADLADLFQNHKFVGCVDQIRALVQHQVYVIASFHHYIQLLCQYHCICQQTKLYIVDLSRIT